MCNRIVRISIIFSTRVASLGRRKRGTRWSTANGFSRRSDSVLIFHVQYSNRTQRLSLMHHCGPLFQRIVDACVNIEASRSNYLRHDRSDLQADMYRVARRRRKMSRSEKCRRPAVVFYRQPTDAYNETIWKLYAGRVNPIYRAHSPSIRRALRGHCAAEVLFSSGNSVHINYVH